MFRSATVFVPTLLVALVLAGAWVLLRLDDWQSSSAIVLGDLQYPVHCVAFSPDGKFVAAGGGRPDLEGEVKLWDVGTGAVRNILRSHRHGVHAAMFAPDGQTLATVGDDAEVKLWDVVTGHERTKLAGFPQAPSLRGAISRGGQALAIAGWERGVVMLWRRVPDAEENLTAGSGPLTFSTDSRHLIWWQLAAALELGGHYPNDQGLAPAGESSNWPAMKTWLITPGQATFTLRGHENHIWSLAFSPDGQILATASSDETVRLWDVPTGQERAILRGHTGHVNGVAFSPDGRQLASVSHDRTLRIWDTTTHQERAVFLGHAGAITCVAFAPSGQSVISGSYDKTVRLWALDKVN